MSDIRRNILSFVIASLLVASVLTISGISRDASATVPGVNGKIAFTSTRDGNSEIYVINPDGTGEARLTNNAASDFHPDWSPNGTKIAFISSRDQFAGEIYVMNADGSGVTRLTTNTGSENFPAWSPDGTKIAFGDGSQNILVMNTDGSGVTH